MLQSWVSAGRNLMRTLRWALPAGLALAFAFFGFVSGNIPVTKPVLADSAKVVSLYFDGQKKVYSTDAGTVGEALKRAGIQLGPNDLSDPSPDTPLTAGLFNINVFRGRPVVIYDGQAATHIISAYDNPRLIAQNAGLKLYPEDDVTAQVVTDFVSDQVVGLRVDIQRALPATLLADGQTHHLRTQAKSVGNLLHEQNISLGEKDTVTPALDDPLSAGATISVTRVAEVVIAKDETITRPVKTVNDPNLVKGTTQVKSEGSDGHRHVTYRIHYQNGVETARETLSVDGQVDPQPKVVVVGTKVFFPGNIEYWRPLVADAAAGNGVDPNLMLAIMRCESNGDATADNGSAFGLFQYQMPTWLNSGGTRSNIFDGAIQIRITAQKIASYGTSPWNASKYCWGGSY